MAELSRGDFLRTALIVTGGVLLDSREGRAAPRYTDPPGTVEAGFLARSYRPGAVAELLVVSPAADLTLQVMKAGAEARRVPHGMGGVPVTAPRRVRWRGGRGILHLRVDDWRTGLHFVQLRDSHGRTGYAPFVVTPAEPGHSRTLVVLPTNTWAAYNFRHAATWYANPEVHQVDLTRPFLGGIPPHYRGYDMGFIRWFAHSGHEADFFSDEDLEAMPSGEELRRLYDLIVFSGHEEYVTEHTYDIVERYQQLRGNLLFLSANNFFYKVVKQGNVMNGRWRWRDLGRPEAQLIGSQYLHWYEGIYKNKPLTVTGAEKAPWLFGGSGLRNGSSFGTYGIEIDAVSPSSPPTGVQVLAEIRDIFGPGMTAQMTHYTTPRGAQVFDAGVLNFGGTADNPGVREMVANLFRHLGPPS